MKIAPLLLASAVLAFATTAGSPEASAGGGAPVPGAPGELAPDGLPVVIPAPGSPPPTVGEWDAEPKEVTVKGSSANNCETKMVREWLRVSCRKGAKTPKSVATTQTHGYQAYVGMFGDKASVVVQVVKGKMYVARYTWTDNSFKDLTVNWPADKPRPVFYFN